MPKIPNNYPLYFVVSGTTSTGKEFEVIVTQIMMNFYKDFKYAHVGDGVIVIIDDIKPLQLTGYWQ